MITKLRNIKEDKVFDIVNVAIMSVALFVFIYPLWFVLIASISSPDAVYNGLVRLFPIGFTLDGYLEVIKLQSVWTGYVNTIIYTLFGTLINVIMTVCAAYPLSRNDFMPKNVLLMVFMFTMYFNGGLIPHFILINNLKMYNTMFALTIPGAIAVYNMIITRTYFSTSIPEEIKEAAEIDGASVIRFFISIVLPLSKPILAVITLFYAVGHWNAFFEALIYISDYDKLPLQMILRDILIEQQTMIEMSGADPKEILYKVQLMDTMKYSVIIIAAVPMLVIYPFVQKFFIKGVMVGAVKG